MPVIDTRDPLEHSYVPTHFNSREEIQEALSEAFAVDTDSRLQHLHVYGPRGTGKTHLLQRFLTTFPPTVTTCYLTGIRHDTQYKALERLYQQLTGTELGTGHHVADVQRLIQEQVTLPTVIVLDEIDFLLLNDGDDLLYFLTRLENTAVITVSANYVSLETELDDRTYSSFRPQHLQLDSYSATRTRQILAERARQALEPESLEQAALSHIAETTQNITIGLVWLREAAETADEQITLDLVRELQPTAYEQYVQYLFDEFTPHHRRLFEAIERLDQEREPPFVTGTVYEEYREHCEATDVTPLSERRVSDFLTHLELLDLIETTTHYGGVKGKTREIRLVEWQSRSDSSTMG